MSSEYYKSRMDEEYEFEKRKRREESFMRPEDFTDLREREPLREVPVIKKRSTMPRMEETKIKPLERDTPKIFGNLFDRVDFLKERITETENTMQERQDLHNEFMREINADIEEKEEMATHITDLDERRNFKLDVSILRREKRQEGIQFWRDILELRTELRELMEKLETEENILDAFKKIEKGD